MGEPGAVYGLRLVAKEGKMIVYVTDSGSDRTELAEVLVQEWVTYQECQANFTRELCTTSYGVLEVQANLPEVKVPPE